MSIWDIIIWLIVGLVAGWIASMIMGRGGYGIVGDIVVGLVGSFIGGILASLIFGSAPNTVSWSGLIVAIIGAIILIAIVRALTGNRTRL